MKSFKISILKLTIGTRQGIGGCQRRSPVFEAHMWVRLQEQKADNAKNAQRNGKTLVAGQCTQLRLS
jgi:hypothetical protein